MRRAQNDSGSQPVRNLAPNPRWLSGGSLTDIRWNHAPDPRMTSTAQGVYGGGTLSLVTGLSGAPEGITTAVRVTHSTSANSGALFGPQPAVSTTYTISCWVYNEGSVVQNIGMAIRSVASNGDVGVQPGVWTKLTWDGYTTPSSMTAFNAIGVRIPTPSQAGTFLVTGIMIEKANVPLGGWFDGSSATNDDHDHVWLGTVNNSVSVQRGRVPSSINTTGTGNKVYFQCSDRPTSGGKFIRMVLDATVPAAINTLGSNVPAGVKRTNLFWLRTSRAMSIQPRYRNASGTATSNTTLITTQANTWQLWRLSDKPSSADNQHLSILISTGTPGDVIDLGPTMCVEGDYQGDYIDGDKPFSKWDGTPNQSTSVGYPPQLLDIAGKPDLDITSGNSGGVAIPVDAMAARTIYFVYECYSSSLNFTNFGSYGVVASKGLLFQTGTAGGTNLSPRLDFPGGATNYSANMSGGRTFRKHVAVLAFPQGLTPIATSLDGGADVSRVPSSVGTGWDDGRAALVTTADGKGLRMLVYYAEHDVTTRLAISRYLGNKYGGYVA